MQSRQISEGKEAKSGWALAVIVTGVLVAAVDTTIVILALPTMMRALHANLADIIWVIMAYLLVITLLATQVGRLGDMFGRVRMYELGFLVFVLGSFLCGIATTETAIIGFRVLQGIGGALISANSGAVIADTFPPEKRGQAYGFTSIGWNLGAILGILLGGLITTYLSWRYIFLINVPIGLAAVIVAWFVLKEHGNKQPRNLDWWGMILLGIGLLLVLLTMIHATSQAFTWHLGIILFFGILALALFVVVETHQTQPMMKLDLFKNRIVSASLLAAFFQAIGNFAVLFLVIMYLQGLRQLTPLNASLLLVPGYLVGGILGPVSGHLSDRFGSALPATVGLSIEAIALFLYAHLGLHTPLWWIIIFSTVNGIGNAGFFPANNAAVMKGSPSGSYGIASGMLRTFANIGMVLSFASALLIASTQIPRNLAFAIFVGTTALKGHLMVAFNHGIHMAFYLAILLMAVAAVFSLLRGSTNLAQKSPTSTQ
ncbi:MFS transporter [Sulfobacillus sp. hq2]|uniref:MFS transporter n=1 Tax=Sulfobacillus TaxID=28033 RepID=UPI000CD1CEF2|nr:MFS transporter [Sulfobacillus sp. hq2]POB09612.1 MFS transporter [Sulfobacillus sp. hq2]